MASTKIFVPVNIDLSTIQRWMETSDIVEVVRCRDCRYYEIMQLKKDGTDDRRYKPSLCVLHNRNFDEDYYCADGERKGGE